ncbi:MAG: hypothetical protein ACM3PC_02135 [Deltaproteobacteria bacterium]
MKFLHILRSETGAIAKLLIAKMPGTTIALNQGAVDYDRLVAEIFQAEKVICWW